MKKTIFTTLSILLVGIIISNISCEKLDIRRIIKIKTLDITEFTYNSAVLNGEFIDISDNTGEFGFCYNTTGNPGINDGAIKVQSPTKKGSFTAQLTGLDRGTKYYVKAYAMDDGKPVYAKEEKSFTTPDPSITVTAPTNTDIWPLKSTRQITWADATNSEVRIELWQKDGASPYHQIAIDPVAGNGLFNWTIPANIPTENGWRVKIINTSDESIFAFSDEFRITSASFVSMQYPDANSKWHKNSEYNIVWDDNFLLNVDILLFKNGTETLTIANNTSSDGSYPWTIPESLTPGTDYQVGVYSHTFQSVYDMSQQFEILAAKAISVTSPIATDNWQMGSTHNITWTDNIAENVRIELYKDGTFSTEIAGSIASTSPYSWTLPTGMEADNDYSIKITMVGDDDVVGDSPEFTISTVPAQPTVTTDNITDIQDNTATCGGNVTDAGSSDVTARGVCWGTSHNPTISDSKEENGTGTGTFISTLINLAENTTYYVRAYATNNEGTAYGEEKTFNFQLSVASLTTGDIVNITNNSASCTSNVTDAGNSYVAIRGVCWDTSPNPNNGHSHATDGGNGTGTYTINLTSLTASTTYYVRAYATNNVGTGYGEEKTFTTNGTVADYDGNTYQTVKIGNQWWMAENLKVTHYEGGTAIDEITDNTTWANLGDNNTDKAFCYYNNNASNEADTYGALYTWAAAMNGASSSTANPSGIQGVCPTGWHLPSDDEWKELEMHLGMSQSEADGTDYRGTNEGSKLAGNASLWTNGILESNAEFGTSGFTAFPSGYRSFDSGTFHSNGGFGYWWGATEYSSVGAWGRRLEYDRTDSFRSNLNYKSYAFPIRCVKN